MLDHLHFFNVVEDLRDSQADLCLRGDMRGHARTMSGFYLTQYIN